MKVRLDLRHPDAANSSDLDQVRLYVVIGIEAGYYRLLNEDEKPRLYPAASFEIVDCSEPPEWEIRALEEGERYDTHSRRNSLRQASLRSGSTATRRRKATFDRSLRRS